GSSLVAAMVADERIDEIVGVARRRPDLTLPKVQWCPADVSGDPLEIVAGADAVVHLAWKIQPQHHAGELYDTNVVGLQRVVDAVVRRRVPRFVHASSVGTYAPAPKSPRLDETWPATGIASSIYSRHKAIGETLLDRI